MVMYSVDELKPGADKASKSPAARKSAPAKRQSDARRFAGEPLVQWARLCRAMEEIIYFRSAGRHHNERETSEVRSHDRWKREATALARAVADALVEGQYEPLKPTQPVPAPEDDVEY